MRGKAFPSGTALTTHAWPAWHEIPGTPAGQQAARRGRRKGFVSNITNPKVLVFYVAVLPQFLTPGAGPTAPDRPRQGRRPCSHAPANRQFGASTREVRLPKDE
jgi:hypothetical protein